MKGIFGFVMVLAMLVCFAMPNESKAAVSLYGDYDVGLLTSCDHHQTMVSTTFDLAESPMICGISGAMIAFEFQYVQERGTKHIPDWWSGADSKASRCEACLGKFYKYNNGSIINLHIVPGKEVRRLSSETKA